MSFYYLTPIARRAIALLFLTVGLGFGLRAQAPLGFKFQAMARDAQDQLLANHEVAVRVNLLRGDASGTISYSERHVVSTSDIGIFDLTIGGGTPLLGDMAAIDWGTDSYFLQIDLDPDGGTDYVNMGATQLLSVPYALYANEAGGGTDEEQTDELQELIYDPSTHRLTITDGNTIDLSNLSKGGGNGGGGSPFDPPTPEDNDATNEIQTVIRVGDSLYLSLGGGNIDLRDADSDPLNEMQDIVLVGNDLSISGGSTVTLPEEADGDVTNEIQQLSLTDNVLSLSHEGGSVTLPAQQDDADADPTNEMQDIVLVGKDLSISGGSTVTLPEEADGDVTNEIQQISLTDNVLSLSHDGGSVTLPAQQDDADADPTNEMQDITLVGNELSITGGSTVTLPEVTDGDATNEIQQISNEGSVIRLSQDGGEIDVASLVDTDDADADPTNEMQDINLVGNELSITGGSTVTLPEAADGDATNEIQQISNEGSVIRLSQDGGEIDVASLVDTDDADADPANELQQLTLEGNVLTLNQNGGSVVLPAAGDNADADADPNNEIQQLSQEGSVIRLSQDGGEIDVAGLVDTNDADADPTNEMQDITLVGNELTITGGSTVTLPEAADGDATNEIQDISLEGDALSISDGSTVLLPDADAENEIQQLSLEGNVLTLNRNGGSVVLPAAGDNADADADPNNEIQDISLVGRELSISAGSTVSLPEETDGDVTNELQQLSQEGSVIRLSQDGGEIDVAGLVDTNDADADPTNEMQDISLVGKELTISGGSTVILPEGADEDASNELQQLTLEGNVLTLNQNGGSVVLPAAGDNADADADPNNEIQDISLVGRELSISAGSTITLPEETDGDVTNELQQLTLEGNVLTLNQNGGSVVLPAAGDNADADADPNNEIQDISLVGRELSISAGSTITLPEETDGDVTNELQQISHEGSVISLSQDGGAIDLNGLVDVEDADADPTNEMQDISVEAGALTITGGSTVELPDGDASNELQQLTLEGNVLTLNRNGGSVVLPAAGGTADADADPNNEIQEIRIDGRELSITGGNTISLPADADADAENELQEMTLMGNILTLSRNGGSVVLPSSGGTVDADADPSNEIQDISLDGRELSISGGSTVSLPEERDGDSTNEIQDISLLGRELSISDGSTVTLPEEADGDATNEIQELKLEGNVLTLNRNGGSVVLPAAGNNADADADPNNEIQDISLTGRELSISGGSTVTLPEDNDGDAANEIQKFNFEGTEDPRVLLSENNANFRLFGGKNVRVYRPQPNLGDIYFDVEIPESKLQVFKFEGTEDPRVVLSENLANFRLFGGKNVRIHRPNASLGDIYFDVEVPENPDADPANELQRLSLNGDVLSLSDGGGSVRLPTVGGTADTDDQRLSFDSATRELTIDGGNTVTIPGVKDSDANPQNELQKLSLSGNVLSLSNDGGSVTLPATTTGGTADADADPTNELQNFNLSGSVDPRISLSGNDANFRLIGGNNTTVARKTMNGDITIDVNDGDGDAQNELQRLSISGNTLSLSNNGGSVTIPVSTSGGTADADADPNNEIQDFRFEGTVNPRILLSRNLANFKLIGGNNVLVTRTAGRGEIKIEAIVPREGDGDPRNELQQLSFDQEARKIYLTDGGEIDLNPFLEDAEARLQATIDSQEALNTTLKQNVEDLQMQLATLAEQMAMLKSKVDGVHPN